MTSFVVPAEENSNQWSAFFARMARGEKADINDKNLAVVPVEGVPPILTDPAGQLQAPRDAGNVVLPPEKAEPLPNLYKEADEMKTARTYKKQQVRKKKKKKRPAVRIKMRKGAGRRRREPKRKRKPIRRR